MDLRAGVEVSPKSSDVVVPENLPLVLTVDEAAAILRVNRKTFYEVIRMQNIPGIIRLGRSIRVSREALLEWVRGKGGPARGGHR